MTITMSRFVINYFIENRSLRSKRCGIIKISYRSIFNNMIGENIMKRIFDFFKKLGMRLLKTIKRFPLSMIALFFLSFVIASMIEDVTYFSFETLKRLLYVGIFAFFFSVFIQFLLERFTHLKKYNIGIILAFFGMAVFYYFFLTSLVMGAAATIRLFIICFALLGLYLYVVSYKDAVDFNHVSLSHLKGFFIAALYSVIMFLGLLAIYYAIDLLLFELDSDIVDHIANIVFIIFAPSYYLSMLPQFNQISSEERTAKAKDIPFYHYPRFLDILVSYILIPLITAYTAVLVVYFIKILVEMRWPIGQIGPMVLVYSAAGLIIYILCNELENRFSVLFRKYFPFMHIPLVILQLISVWIRLQAYGFTESRYYVALFGIYSIICSLYLIISKKKNASMIVLLSACFAIFSIIPPLDAFHVSKSSQTQRIEKILESNGMLIDGTLIQNTNISDQDKYEIRSIIFYMADTGHLDSLEWISDEINDDDLYRDFERIFGFPAYGGGVKDPSVVNVNLYPYTPFEVSGYDIILKYDFNYRTQQSETISFEFNSVNYMIEFASIDDNSKGLVIFDNEEDVLETIPIDNYLLQVEISYNQIEEYQLDLSQMRFEGEGNNFDHGVIFEYVYLTTEDDGSIDDASGSMYILLKIK